MARPAAGGRVFLIGAGPGDPDLLTLRARELLAAADLIVHEPGIPAAVLRHAGPRAKRIEVRRGSGRTALSRDAVRRHLIGPARRGRRVAVVKPGDPFLCGGGGEEADLLHRAGIRFEVIPGVPAVLAGPSYAGIPFAFGAGGATVSFHTGEPSGSVRGASRRRRDRGGVEIHCLSSRSRLAGCLRRLRRSAPAARPAAVVGRPTRPDQSVVVSTVGDIGAALRKARIGFPAILITGPTVPLRRRLRWFETRPLHGIRAVVTRAADQSGPLVGDLRALGADVLEMPMIDFGPPASWKGFDRAAGRLGRYDWVVFTSANGVRFALDRLLRLGRDARALSRARLAAIGPKTADVLLERGLRADRIPAAFLAEGLLRTFPRRQVRGKRFLLARGQLAPPYLADELRARGARVDNVVVYRTVRPDAGHRREWGRALAAGVDLVTFTSSSTVAHFIETFGGRRVVAALQAARIACIGPVTAATARQFGLRTEIVAPVHTIAGLVEAIVDHFPGANRRG